MSRLWPSLSVLVFSGIASANTLQPLHLGSQLRVSSAQNAMYGNSFYSQASYQSWQLGRGATDNKVFGSALNSTVTAQIYDVHVLASGTRRDLMYRSDALKQDEIQDELKFGASFPVGPNMNFGLGVTHDRWTTQSRSEASAQRNFSDVDQYDFGFAYADRFVEVGVAYHPKVETSDAFLPSLAQIHSRFAVADGVGFGFMVQREAFSALSDDLKDQWSALASTELAISKADRFELKAGYKHHYYEDEDRSVDSNQKAATYGVAYSHAWKNQAVAATVFAEGQTSILNKNKTRYQQIASGVAVTAQL